METIFNLYHISVLTRIFKVRTHFFILLSFFLFVNLWGSEEQKILVYLHISQQEEINSDYGYQLMFL